MTKVYADREVWFLTGSQDLYGEGFLGGNGAPKWTCDASHYAAWLSRQTGEFWRLPTDAEWAFAAGSRFADDGLGLAANAADPSQR